MTTYYLFVISRPTFCKNYYCLLIVSDAINMRDRLNESIKYAHEQCFNIFMTETLQISSFNVMGM